MVREISRRSSPSLDHQSVVPRGDLPLHIADNAQRGFLGEAGAWDTPILDFDAPLGYPAVAMWENNDFPSLLSGPSDGNVTDPHANNITDAPFNLLENTFVNIPTSFGGLGDPFHFSADVDIGIPQDASFQNLPQLTDLGFAAWQPGPVVLLAIDSDLPGFVNFDTLAGHLPGPNYDTNNTVCFPPTGFPEPAVLWASPSIPAVPSPTGNSQNRLVPILPKLPRAPSEASSTAPSSQLSRREVCRATGVQNAPDKPIGQKRKRKGRIGIPPTPNCDSFPLSMGLQVVATPESGKKRHPYTKKTCFRCQALKEKCSGGFPCDRCVAMWTRNRNRRMLEFTACSDSDIRELNFFTDIALLFDESADLSDYHKRLRRAFNQKGRSVNLSALEDLSTTPHNLDLDRIRSMSSSVTKLSRHKKPLYWGPEKDLDVRRCNGAAKMGWCFYKWNSKWTHIRERFGEAVGGSPTQLYVSVMFFEILDDHFRKIKLGKYNQGDIPTAMLLSILSLAIEDAQETIRSQLGPLARPEGRRVTHFVLKYVEEKLQHLRSYVEWLLAKRFGIKRVDYSVLKRQMMCGGRCEEID